MNKEALAVSVPDAAARIGIGTTLCWRLIWQHQLPSIKVGRRVVVPVEALDEWVRVNTQPAEIA